MALVRRSGRIAKEIGILLLGTDTMGRVFSEETKTVTLSRHGAGVVSQHRWAPDERLTLRFLGGTSEVSVRLVGEMGHDARGYTYGVSFVDPELDFWELKFPPPPQWHGAVESEMECSLCLARDVVDQTEVEADVYALTQYILRFCPRCGTSTEWRHAAGDSGTPFPRRLPSPPTANHDHHKDALSSESANRFASSRADDAEPGFTRSEGSDQSAVGVELPEAQPQEERAPEATAVVAGTANRRRDVRTGVNFTGCIRQGSSDDEIVECDNLSRGGLSFRSRQSYALDSIIEVAAPYSLGAHAIFVPACIKHVEALPGGTLFRYGAAYAQPRKRTRDF
jgi:hypothetical protein